MTQLLDKSEITRALNKLCDSITSDQASNGPIALVGIRSRGEILAQRLCKCISKKIDSDLECGTLDITLYRDDLNDPQSESQPVVRSTEIDFDINGKIIILVDDVLFTGRSVRAALDALIDLGRPKAIRLAVLVERHGREYPIQADYIGEKVKLTKNQSVQVHFKETDGEDKVFIK